jgi:molecular chaperone GrpE
MNPQDQTFEPTGESVDLDAETVASVEDFIRELEEKERDLHITSELSIEIADVDLDSIDSLPLVDAPQTSAPAAPQPAPEKPDPAPRPERRTEDLRTRKPALEDEIASLKMRVYELRNERNEVQEKSDRRLKEFENYRYRVDRERRGAFIDQLANLAGQILPVLDNLNRAIDTLPPGSQKATPEFEKLFDGIVLVNQQMNEVLAGMGITPIASVGETFDPNLHEAVATEERSDMPANTVSEELLRGYRIGNKVVRHSMVKVVMNNGSKKSKPVPKSAQDDSDAGLDLDGTLA